MKAISGEISYQGEIFINERDINSMKAWELAAIRAVLPQNSSVAFPFTVAEVIHIGLRNTKDSSTDHLINDALDCVGLLSLAKREYSQLSGGEQQRVQLARVLAQVWSPLVDGTAKWIFLDEPVSSLDISYQLEVMNIMHEITPTEAMVYLQLCMTLTSQLCMRTMLDCSTMGNCFALELQVK